MSTLTTGGVLQDSVVNTLKPTVPGVVGSQGSNQNLTLRSTNSPLKGTVLVDEPTPSYGPNSGALQVIGGIGAQHSMSTGGYFMHSPFWQSVTNVVIPPGFGGSYGTVATYPTIPTVTFSAPQSPGGITAQGIAVVSSNTVVGVAITNPGTGYTAPPTVTFSDPIVNSTTTTVVTYIAGLVVSAGQFVKVFQTAAGPTNGLVYYYSVTAGGTFNTTTPTHTSGSSAASGPTLLFIGSLAQGYASVGYSGMLTQGCLHEVGGVYGVTMTNIGSSYTQAPAVTFSPPQLPGGRIAQGLAVMSLPWQVATTSLSSNGSTWTVNTNAQPTAYVTGQVVTISGVTPTAYNGTWVITGVSTTQFTVTTTVNPGASSVNGNVNIQMSGSVLNVQMIDPGSGYLSPPTVTFTAQQGGGTGAAGTALIGNPGVKPIVTTPPATVTGGYYPNTYFVDFGLTGPDTVYLTLGTSSSIYFDNLAGTGSVNITSITSTATTWTVNTSAQQVPWVTGQIVNIQGCTPTAYNGQYAITGVSTTQFTVANTSNPGASTVNGMATIVPGYQQKGFPQGRKITIFVKTTAAITVTFPNACALHTNTGSNAAAMTANRTGRFEFVVAGSGNTPFDIAGTFIFT